MKATIDFDEALYRRLKVEAARRGRTVRELVAEGVRHVLGVPAVLPAPQPDATPAWFGGLRGYADNAGGKHDIRTMRRSIAERRKKK